MNPARHPLRLLLAAALLLSALFFAWYFLPLQYWSLVFLTALRGLGDVALIVYAVIYIIATLIMVPLAPLAIGAGYLFGLYTSFAVTLAAATIGAVAAFLLSRRLLASTFQRVLRPHPVLAATEHSIAEQGWLVVFLLRLSPVIPSHLLNYLCGITTIPAWHYIIATLLGKAPLIFLLSYIGALTARSLEIAPTSMNGRIQLIAAGLVFTGIACWLIAHRARQILKRQGLVDE